MKLFAILIIGCGLLVSAPDCLAQRQKKTKPAPAAKMPDKPSVRGAASIDVLGHFVYSAIQENNFSSIEQYFPTESDISITENRTPDKDLQAVLEGKTPDQVQASFRRDFEELQTNSIHQGINFKSLSLMEVTAGMPLKANRLIPAHLILTNSSNQTIDLVFEVLKVNGRFFLFEHIDVKQEQ